MVILEVLTVVQVENISFTLTEHEFPLQCS